jgi:F-type H+-transporting ATPase subunit gamma
MRRLQEIDSDRESMQTVAELTSVFESLASMHIAQIKNQVQRAQTFFEELWQIYGQLRVDTGFHMGHTTDASKLIKKELFVVITAEGSFSGDIDQKLISWMLTQFDPAKQDIIVIGHHGALQLIQLNVKFKKYFKLPVSDTGINVLPLIKEIQQYQACYVYYQTYVSLSIQDVKRISLSAAVENQGKSVSKGEEIISDATYLFEPNSFGVASHLERSMMSNMLGQVIFESKLAQYASRFQAMTSAHKKADDNVEELQLSYNRVRRGIKDERLKEIINGLRKTRVS